MRRDEIVFRFSDEIGLDEAVGQYHLHCKQREKLTLRHKRRELRDEWIDEIASREIFAEQRGAMPLKSRSLVAFDLEGAGFAPEDIVELGAVRVDLMTRQVYTFEQLVRPRARMNPHATAITGITNADLKGKPLLRDILPEFLRFIGKTPVVGHGIFNSDLMQLNYARKRCRAGRRLFAPRFIDTELVARRMHAMNGGEPPDMRFNLESLLALYSIEVPGRHRALSDAFASYLLLRALLDDVGIEHGLPMIEVRLEDADGNP